MVIQLANSVGHDMAKEARKNSSQESNTSIFDQIRAQYRLVLNKEAPEVVIERRGSKDTEIDWTPRIAQSVPNSPRSNHNSDSEFQRELKKFFIDWYRPHINSNGNFKDDFYSKNCGNKNSKVEINGETQNNIDEFVTNQ